MTQAVALVSVIAMSYCPAFKRLREYGRQSRVFIYGEMLRKPDENCRQVSCHLCLPTSILSAPLLLLWPIHLSTCPPIVISLKCTTIGDTALRSADAPYIRISVKLY